MNRLWIFIRQMDLSASTDVKFRKGDLPMNSHERLNFRSLFTKANLFQYQGISESVFLFFLLSFSFEKFTDISRFDRERLTP